MGEPKADGVSPGSSWLVGTDAESTGGHEAVNWSLLQLTCSSGTQTRGDAVAESSPAWCEASGADGEPEAGCCDRLCWLV